MIKFEKSALSHGQLLDFLIAKGLIISDREDAVEKLTFIGYYRLKIYTRHFEDTNKRFVGGVTFDDVIALYNFDRRLRLQCLDAIERIEVALRSAIIEVMGSHGGPHFFYDEDYFENREVATSIRSMTQRAKDDVRLSHYKATYSKPHIPPIWTILECSSFGDASRIFSALGIAYRKQISKNFKMGETIAVSWMRTLVDLRNICAHHNRLWNRHIVVNRPAVIRAHKREFSQNEKIYCRLAMLKILLDVVDNENSQKWAFRLARLIDSRPRIQLSDMGIPEDWKDRQLWSDGANDEADIALVVVSGQVHSPISTNSL